MRAPYLKAAQSAEHHRREQEHSEEIDTQSDQSELSSTENRSPGAQGILVPGRKEGGTCSFAPYGSHIAAKFNCKLMI